MQIKDRTGIIPPLKRGDVYMVSLDRAAGSTTSDARPALIIQNDVGNKFSPITIVAPISWAKEIPRPLPITIFLEKGEAGLNEESYVDCGQIRTVNKEERLISKCGTLDKPKMKEVDKALRISLSID